jgi:2-dehydropantoate 2-reductase
MRIAVIGAGGVGGYFGGRLAQAGHRVQFLARGRQLEALQARGLAIESAAGYATISPIEATGDPSALAGADVVLVTTKLWDLAATARQIAPAVGPQTVVIPFQNGVDAVDLLAEAIPRERIAGGVAYIAATIREPGVIAQTGTMARLRVGPLAPAQRPVLQALTEAGIAAGYTAELVDDAERILWEKFVFLNAFSGLTSLTRQHAEAIRSDPDLRATFAASIAEVIRLAGHSGVQFPAGFEAAQLQALDNLPPTMRSSMLNDLQAGNRIEAPWLCGAVARRSAQAGLEAPVNRTIWAALKPYVEGRPG